MVLEKQLGLSVGSAEGLAAAAVLLRGGGYGCVVIDPLDPAYLCNETESPAVAFIREQKERGIGVVVASTYIRESFDRNFGLKEGGDYDAYFAKPFFDGTHAAFFATVKKLCR